MDPMIFPVELLAMTLLFINATQITFFALLDGMYVQANVIVLLCMIVCPLQITTTLLVHIFTHCVLKETRTVEELAIILLIILAGTKIKDTYV